MTNNQIGLGRRHAKDKRDLTHLMTRAPSGITQRFWSVAQVLDQKATSQCVAFAGYGYLTCGPIVNRHPAQEP